MACFKYIRRVSFCLHVFKFFVQVLDEADSLLRSSFSADLENILHKIPVERQTILFSATTTEALKKLFATSNKDVFMWNVPNKYVIPIY